MMYGYKEVRVLGRETLRMLCIERRWYTKGTNEEYETVLKMASKDNITTDDIVEIATDIVEHSNLATYEEFTDVCNAIVNKCHTFFEEI